MFTKEMHIDSQMKVLKYNKNFTKYLIVFISLIILILLVVTIINDYNL